jgi:hydroxyquinol 1,2-dioxygenase
MRNIDEHTITEAVVRSFDGCPDPRLKTILVSLATHLHDFAREVRLTEGEWERGIRFLTETGQKCCDVRQEFILLSDVLGLSMLTIAMNHAKPAGATEATVTGPFFVPDAPACENGADIAGGAPGDPLAVDVRVLSEDGTPVPGAQVDIWQADDDGLYDVQVAELGERRRARATMRTDAEGRLRFRTVVPVAYRIPTDGPVGQLLGASGRHPWRPAHIHFMIDAPGHQRLVTHLFLDGDHWLDSDAVFGVRNSLVVPLAHQAGDVPGLHHDFVLARVPAGADVRSARTRPA